MRERPCPNPGKAEALQLHHLWDEGPAQPTMPVHSHGDSV